MSSFSESALEKKLSELSNSQQSVQTLSLWIIHHRKHSPLIVKVWHRELKKGKCFLPSSYFHSISYIVLYMLFSNHSINHVTDHVSSIFDEL